MQAPNWAAVRRACLLSPVAQFTWLIAMHGHVCAVHGAFGRGDSVQLEQHRLLTALCELCLGSHLGDATD